MDSLLEAVKTSVPIEEGLSHFGVEIPHRGRDPVMVRCPWHEDRSPSMAVYRRKGRAWCFACQRGGDIIDVTAIFLDTDLKGALEYWTDRLGLSTDRPISREKREHLRREARDRRERERCQRLAKLASLLAERGLPRPRDEEELSLYDWVYAMKDGLDYFVVPRVEDRETLSSFLSKLRRWRLTAEVTLRGGAKNLRPLPAITGRGAPRACRRSVIEYESHKCEEGVGDSNFCGPGAYTAGSAVFTWCQQPNKTSEGVIECHHANQDT